MKMSVFIFALVMLWPTGGRAQQQAIDSLSALLKGLPDGPEKIEALSQLTKLYLNIDLEKAGSYALEQARIGQKTQNPLAVAAAWKDIGVIHLIGSTFDSSWHYSQRALGAYQRLMAKGAGALAALEAYLVAHDSVTNTEKFRAVEDLSTQYETQKKEATIAEQQEALRQGKIRFWLIAGILAIALAAGAALYALTRQLRRRNTEKELLIKEVHHRVKNNLQVLSSLLHLQSRHIQDETALDALREGQSRVESMSLIHQKLYVGDNLAAVDMPDYLHHLGNTLLDAYRLDDGRISISYEIAPLQLDVDTAIPLGLIINELVANSLKYAFPNERKGTIAIALWKNNAGKLCLKVADDGVGKAAAPTLKSSTSFGANLVDMLSRKLKGAPVAQDAADAATTGFTTKLEFSNYAEAAAAPTLRKTP